MRELRPSRFSRGTTGQGPSATVLLLAVVALSLVAAGCSGKRPELVTSSGQAATETSAMAETTIPAAAIQAADCVAASGGGPWQVTIEAAVPPAITCVRLATHQRIEFVNTTADPVSFELAGLAVNLQPSEAFLTEPAGSFLQPGLTELSSVPHPISGLWVSDPSENTLAGLAIGLDNIGPVTVGATPVEITAALEGAAVAASDAACYVTSIAGDPYSPLFTISDGTLSVIQVFTPGQLTRSEVGVGSSEGEVLTAYGDRIESQPSPDGDPAKKLLVFVPVDQADQQFRLVFALENDTVTSLRNGLTDPAISNPDCSG